MAKQDIVEYQYTKGDKRASENGKKGQPKAAAARRRNANISRMMNSLLANNTTTYEGREVTLEEALCLSMITQAIVEGDASAARFVADAADSALKYKEVKARIKKLEAETAAIKQKQEELTGETERVVIVDDL